MTKKAKPRPKSRKEACKDCIPDDESWMVSQYMGPAPRPAPHPGPRCWSHWGKEKKRRKDAAHETRAQRTYGLGPGDYDRLYALQGGRCPICLRATGATRKLSIDHDHATGDVRGLLCRPCNSLLGHARDELDFFKRAYRYLKNPPARQLEVDP